MSYLNRIIRYPITLTHLILKKIFKLIGYDLIIRYKKNIPKKNKMKKLILISVLSE